MAHSKVSTYATLMARGCLCGTDRPQECPLHIGSDNRGLAAFFGAGMPESFPVSAKCSECHSEGLLYPNVDLDLGTGPVVYKSTFVCPKCSAPVDERLLIAEAISSGIHLLNGRRVFAEARAEVA